MLRLWDIISVSVPSNAWDPGERRWAMQELKVLLVKGGDETEEERVRGIEVTVTLSSTYGVGLSSNSLVVKFMVVLPLVMIC